MQYTINNNSVPTTELHRLNRHRIRPTYNSIFLEVSDDSVNNFFRQYF